MRVFVTGDVHGENDFWKLSEFNRTMEGELDRHDWLLVAGDAGFAWDGGRGSRARHALTAIPSHASREPFSYRHEQAVCPQTPRSRRAGGNGGGAGMGIDAKPFVKWLGGKSKVLEFIRLQYPPGLGDSIDKYAEPFVGGGAVLFELLNDYRLREVSIGDANRELVGAYLAARDDVQGLVSQLRELEGLYLAADASGRDRLYYQWRDRFNTLKLAGSEGTELAALFVALNKTCFNGLYRVNSSGEMNASHGGYKNPVICDAGNLAAVSEKLQGVTIAAGDYRESGPFIDERTFVYLDPPYRPITKTASFTSYGKGKFGDAEQAELARFFREMGERGARVLESNSDPHSADETDDFFDDLYHGYRIRRIIGPRAISCSGAGRGVIGELLISNY